jgi:hypothetical protein
VVIVDSTHDYAKSMFKIYPELPVKTENGRSYVVLYDFLAYLKEQAYL